MHFSRLRGHLAAGESLIDEFMETEALGHVGDGNFHVPFPSDPRL